MRVRPVLRELGTFADVQRWLSGKDAVSGLPPSQLTLWVEMIRGYCTAQFRCLNFHKPLIASIRVRASTNTLVQSIMTNRDRKRITTRILSRGSTHPIE